MLRIGLLTSGGDCFKRLVLKFTNKHKQKHKLNNKQELTLMLVLTMVMMTQSMQTMK